MPHGITQCYLPPGRGDIPKVARCRRTAEAQFTRSLGLGYKLCAVIPVAGQRAPKVTSQVATPGAKSAVCNCFVANVAF